MIIIAYFIISIFFLLGLYFVYKVYNIYRKYFSTPRNIPLLRSDLSDLSGVKLGHYYVHAGGNNVKAIESGLYSDNPFDDDGIPMVDYGGTIGKQYNPCTIAQYALEIWELLLQTTDQKYQDIFLKQVEWLMKNQSEGKWCYHFDINSRGLKAPWTSAMAQGQGISILLRAWQLTGNLECFKVAQKAFSILEIPVDQGGVLYKEKSSLWFEEYPDQINPTHVLNGHLWTLFGIWDMYRVTEDQNVLKLFMDGVSAVISDIDKYDTGYWVKYDQKSPAIVNGLYMGFQIEQLKVIYAITHDSVFLNYIDKWTKYQKNKWNFLRILCYICIQKLKSSISS